MHKQTTTRETSELNHDRIGVSHMGINYFILSFNDKILLQLESLQSGTFSVGLPFRSSERLAEDTQHIPLDIW